MKSTIKIAAMVLLLGAAGSTSACRMYEEGHLTDKKIQVSEEKIVREFTVDGNHYGALRDISQSYERYGDGSVHLTLAYNPASRSATAMKATQEAADIAAWLRNEGGVAAVRTDILPVRNTDGMKAIVTYNSYAAHGPDCDSLLAGFEDSDHKTDMDYKMGCTVQNVIARQVSRPKDLLGRDFNTTHKDARGVSNQIEVYRSGAQNPSMGGEGTSE